MVVDARETQVFEGRLAQKLKEAVLGDLEWKRPGAYLSEKGLQFGAGHSLGLL
jgi:hypothetical protein